MLLISSIQMHQLWIELTLLIFTYLRMFGGFNSRTSPLSYPTQNYSPWFPYYYSVHFEQLPNKLHPLSLRHEPAARNSDSDLLGARPLWKVNLDHPPVKWRVMPSGNIAWPVSRKRLTTICNYFYFPQRNFAHLKFILCLRPLPHKNITKMSAEIYEWQDYFTYRTVNFGPGCWMANS